ncbi:hypothetical protein BH23ACT5_BH23ACT5_22590 [soil metagenome]
MTPITGSYYPEVREDDIEEVAFNVAIGSRLRAARKRRGWSLTEVERLSDQEFKASVLGAYERGERSLSVHRLFRLAGLYGLTLPQLIPTQSDLNPEPSPEVTVDLAAFEAADESAVLDRFLSSIHLMRREESGEMTVRTSDIAVLSSMLEVLAVSADQSSDDAPAT